MCSRLSRQAAVALHTARNAFQICSGDCCLAAIFLEAAAAVVVVMYGQPPTATAVTRCAITCSQPVSLACSLDKFTWQREVECKTERRCHSMYRAHSGGSCCRVPRNELVSRGGLQPIKLVFDTVWLLAATQHHHPALAIHAAVKLAGITLRHKCVVPCVRTLQYMKCSI